MQKKKKEIEVMFLLLHLRQAAQNAQTRHDYHRNHVPRSYMTGLHSIIV